MIKNSQLVEVIKFETDKFFSDFEVEDNSNYLVRNKINAERMKSIQYLKFAEALDKDNFKVMMARHAVIKEKSNWPVTEGQFYISLNRDNIQELVKFNSSEHYASNMLETLTVAGHYDFGKWIVSIPKKSVTEFLDNFKKINEPKGVKLVGLLNDDSNSRVSIQVIEPNFVHQIYHTDTIFNSDAVGLYTRGIKE